MKLHRPRGTRDFTPAETEKRRYIENRMRLIAENWGYEEAVVNALYHRSYQDESPVEVRIFPSKIEIISYPGPLPPLDKDNLTFRRSPSIFHNFYW